MPGCKVDSKGLVVSIRSYEKVAIVPHTSRGQQVYGLNAGHDHQGGPAVSVYIQFLEYEATPTSAMTHTTFFRFSSVT